MGRDQVLQVNTTPDVDLAARFPDKGSSLEVYSSPDPLAYLELETLGPLQRLAAPQSMSARVVYTVRARQSSDDEHEARLLLGLMSGPTPTHVNTHR